MSNNDKNVPFSWCKWPKTDRNPIALSKRYGCGCLKQLEARRNQAFGQPFQEIPTKVQFCASTWSLQVIWPFDIYIYTVHGIRFVDANEAYKERLALTNFEHDKMLPMTTFVFERRIGENDWKQKVLHLLQLFFSLTLSLSLSLPLYLG